MRVNTGQGPPLGHPCHTHPGPAPGPLHTTPTPSPHTVPPHRRLPGPTSPGLLPAHKCDHVQAAPFKADVRHQRSDHVAALAALRNQPSRGDTPKGNRALPGGPRTHVQVPPHCPPGSCGLGIGTVRARPGPCQPFTVWKAACSFCRPLVGGAPSAPPCAPARQQGATLGMPVGASRAIASQSCPLV